MTYQHPTFVLASMLTLSVAASASAHGGGVSLYAYCYEGGSLFAYDVSFPEDSPDTVIVATNFGMLVSDDAGATFGWVCPHAYAVPPNPDYRLPLPPTMSVAEDGTTFMFPLSGYAVSRDGACNFERPTNESLRRADVRNVVFNPSNNDVLAAINWPADPPFGVYRSTDGGRTFDETKIAGTNASVFDSIMIGGELLYTLSKLSEGAEYVLWRSNLAGNDYTKISLGIFGFNALFGGPDPDDASTFYMTSSRASDAACAPETTVYRSEMDGDERTIIDEREDILVGTVPRSGSSIWLGWKDDGVMRVTGPDEIETLPGTPAPLSLLAAGRRATELAMGAAGTGNELVVLRDVDTGESTPLLTRSNITGVLSCPSSSDTAKLCGAMWTEVARMYGLGPSGTTDGGATNDAGDDSDANVVRPDGASDGGTENNGSHGGCGCKIGASHARWPAAGSLGLMIVLVWSMRARRRLRRLALAVVAAVALAFSSAGCSQPGENPIDFSLLDDQFWPDLRVYPGVGEGRLVITNNYDDTVSILDASKVGTDELEEIARVPVGLVPVQREGPHHVATDSTGENYYVGISNYLPGSGSGPHGAHGVGTDSGHVLKIRGSDNVQITSVRVDRSPGDIRMARDGHTLLVSHFDLLRISETLMSGGDEREMYSRLAVIDTASMTRQAMIALCPAAHGIVSSPDGRFVYVTCLNDRIAIADLQMTQAPVTQVPVIAEPGTVTDPQCEPYALTMTHDGTSIFVSCLEDGRILRFNAVTGAMDEAWQARLPGPAVFGAVTQDDQTLIVPYQARHGIAFIDVSTSTITESLDFPTEVCINPHSLRFMQNDRWLLVVCEGDHVGPGALLVLDMTTRSVQRRVEVGVFPDDVALLARDPESL